MKTVLYSAPTVEPVEPDELRDELWLDSHEQDSLLSKKLDEALAAAETRLWKRLITQTWDQYFDGFADPLVLEVLPVQSITAITYMDSNGDWQTLASSVYELGYLNEIGLVRLQYSQAWPITRGVPDCVKVRYSVGYGDSASDVPPEIKAAIRLHAAHYFKNRNGEPLPVAFNDLLDPLSARRCA